MAGAAGCVTAAKGQTIPSETKRYKDSATEFDVYRLTDPAHQSWLPASYERAVSRRDSFLIYSSDRAGSVQAYRMDLKSGQSRTLTRAENLVRESLTLAPDERNFYYLDGRSVYMANLGNAHTREVHRIEEGFDLGRGFSVSEDGLYARLVEQKPGTSRLRLITLRSGGAQTVVESPEPISDPLPRPRRAGVLYHRGNELRSEAGKEPAAVDHVAFRRRPNGSGIARTDFRSSAAAAPRRCVVPPWKRALAGEFRRRSKPETTNRRGRIGACGVVRGRQNSSIFEFSIRSQATQQSA